MFASFQDELHLAQLRSWLQRRQPLSQQAGCVCVMAVFSAKRPSSMPAVQVVEWYRAGIPSRFSHSTSGEGLQRGVDSSLSDSV
jgi:hypothetical protein